jgi:hypothetical protein
LTNGSGVAVVVAAPHRRVQGPFRRRKCRWIENLHPVIKFILGVPKWNQGELIFYRVMYIYIYIHTHLFPSSSPPIVRHFSCPGKCMRRRRSRVLPHSVTDFFAELELLPVSSSGDILVTKKLKLNWKFNF